MPMYDFHCENCDATVELYLKSAEVSPNCEACHLPMEYSPSFAHTSKAQGFTPVVIHRDPSTGKLRFPGSSDAKVPSGYERVELTTLAQVRKLEQSVNSQDRVTANKFRDVRSKFLDGQLAHNRAEVRAKVEQFTPRGKRFYERMREASEAKQKAGRSHSNPEFVVDAFTYDSSNRQGFYDERNQHGSGNRGK